MDDLDFVDLVLNDHVRVARLFEELEEAADDPARLVALWTELRRVLLAHLGAFEEIFLLPLLGTAADRLASMRQLNAEKIDVLDAIAEARLQPTGSPLWWLAVRAARASASRHISSVEAGGLSKFGQQTPEQTIRELARQWGRFMADLSRDGL